MTSPSAFNPCDFYRKDRIIPAPANAIITMQREKLGSLERSRDMKLSVWEKALIPRFISFPSTIKHLASYPAPSSTAVP
jgi:hypothetical protein